MRTAELDPQDEIVVYCHQGVRSAASRSTCATSHGFKNVKNLAGGLDLWGARSIPDAPVLMADGAVRVERAHGVVRCTLDRPPLNLFEPGMIAALRDTFHALAADTSVRAVVLTGAGRAFTAGMDVHVLRDLDVTSAKALISSLCAAIDAVPPRAVPVHRRRQRRLPRRRLRAGAGVRPAAVRGWRGLLDCLKSASACRP